VRMDTRRKFNRGGGERCPICGEQGFPYLKPVKAKGRSYTYLYFAHYSKEKYRKSGPGRSHIRWCYVGRSVEHTPHDVERDEE